MKLTHEEAPMREEITIEAPAEPLMQRAERILFGKRRPRTVYFADLCIDLYEHALSLEADARIKAANANPGELLEFRGLHGETIVARMVK